VDSYSSDCFFSLPINSQQNGSPIAKRDGLEMDTSTLTEIKEMFNDGQKDFKQGNFESAMDTFQDILKRFRDAGNSEGMAEVSYQLANCQIKLGYYQDAIMNLKESLELFRFLKKHERVAITVHALGVIHAELEEDEIASKYLEEAKAIYREKSIPNGEGAVLFELGNLSFKDNVLDEATNYYEKAQEIFERIDNAQGIANIQYMLALIAFENGDLAATQELLEKAKEKFIAIADITGQVKIQAMEGLLALNAKDYTKAEQIFKDCMKQVSQHYKKETGAGTIDRQTEVHVLMDMGSLILQDSKLNLPNIGKTLNLKAYEYFEEASALSEKIRFKQGKCQAMFNMGLIMFERGDIASANESNSKLEVVLDLAKEINNNELIVKSLLILGTNSRRLSKFEQALNYLQDCIAIAKHLKYVSLEISALLERFKIFFRIGKLSDALGTLDTAREIAKKNPDLKKLEAEVLMLTSDYFQVTGELDKASESLLESQQIYEDLNYQKGTVDVLSEMVKLDERQGFFTHAIACLSEIEMLHKNANRLYEMSRARIIKARLVFQSGDIEEAGTLIRNEIAFLRDAGISDADSLVAEANFILFKILKSKNEILESDEIFRDILKYYSENKKILELFDVIIETAYESLERGNISSLKQSIEKLWKIIKGQKETLEYNERLIYFLHVYGLIHQQEGALEFARKYFNECLVVIQKMNMDNKKGVILAQLGDLSLIEGKADAYSLFIDALESMEKNGKIKDIVNIQARIAEIVYDQGNLDDALNYALEAVKGVEHESIVKNRFENVHGLQNAYKFYTRDSDIYTLLGSLYVEKFTQENDYMSLERALIATQFQKIYAMSSRYFAKHFLNIYSCAKLEKYVELDDMLCHEASMKQNLVEFLTENLEYQARLLTSSDVKKDFAKRNMDFLDQKINEERASLVEVVKQVKMNRARLMECKDPGSFVPFIGFNILKQIQKTLVDFDEIAIIDYVIWPLVSKIGIFLLYKDYVELILHDTSSDFFELLKQLHEAIQQGKQASIVFTHQKLTEWLFPPQLKDRLIELGVKYPFICPDLRMNDVNFNLLGEENNVSGNFVLLCMPHLLCFKNIMQGGYDAHPDSSMDFYLLFPDIEDERTLEEWKDLDNFFKRQDQGQSVSNVSMLLDSGSASYQAVKEIATINPGVVHFSGSCYASTSVPFDGFLNMNDRAFFWKDFMELDLENKSGLVCLSFNNDEDIDIQQALFTWRTLSLSNMPYLICASSKYGYSGRIFSFLYDRMLKGDTIGEAYMNCNQYFSKMQEISPLARTNHIVIANPFWKLRSAKQKELEDN